MLRGRRAMGAEPVNVYAVDMSGGSTHAIWSSPLPELAGERAWCVSKPRGEDQHTGDADDATFGIRDR